MMFPYHLIGYLTTLYVNGLFKHPLLIGWLIDLSLTLFLLSSVYVTELFGDDI